MSYGINDIKVIKAARAAGKTTKALQLLQATGGGAFITSSPMQAMAIVRHMKLDKVKIISIDPGFAKGVVIDDADQLDLTITTTLPIELREI